MSQVSFSARYTAAMAECGGRCPIEAGVLCRLADHDFRHSRLPDDRTAPWWMLDRRGRSAARAATSVSGERDCRTRRVTSGTRRAIHASSIQHVRSRAPKPNHALAACAARPAETGRFSSNGGLAACRKSALVDPYTSAEDVAEYKLAFGFGDTAAWAQFPQQAVEVGRVAAGGAQLEVEAPGEERRPTPTIR